MIILPGAQEAPHWYVAFTHDERLRRDELALQHWLKRKGAPPQLRPLDAVKFPRRAFFAHYHGKCAYCEVRLDEATARVDRFRPVDNARQPGEPGRVDLHHYRWLVWEWTNLRLACTTCDQRKRSFFPTQHGLRAIPGHRGADLLDEPILLLDPGSPVVNPLRHLAFDAYGAVTPRIWRGKPSPQGAITIELLDLNRPELRQKRAAQVMRALDGWDQAVRAARRGDETAFDQAMGQLKELCVQQAEFAGAVRQQLYGRWLDLCRDDQRLSETLKQRQPWRRFCAELRAWNTRSSARPPRTPPPEPDPAPPDPAPAGPPAPRSSDERPLVLPPGPETIVAASTASVALDLAPVGVEREAMAPREAHADTIPARADILLVTATDIERAEVLRLFKRKLGRKYVRYHQGKNTYYYLGSLKGAEIVLVQSGMGAGGARGAILTINDSIAHLTPTAVIMLGIAYGMDEQRQQIGDILVAEQLLSYDMVKEGETTIDRNDRPEASALLLDRFSSGKVDWRGARVNFGLLLSGGHLIDNREFRDKLRALAPEAIGGEMEGGGLYAAAYRRGVEWILVKAICDFADGHKGHPDKDRRQRRAARNAALFVFHVLSHGGIAQMAPAK